MNVALETVGMPTLIFISMSFQFRIFREFTVRIGSCWESIRPMPASLVCCCC